MSDLNFLVGSTVLSIAVDRELTMRVQHGADEGLIVLTRFRFTDAGGGTRELDAETDRPGLVTALCTRSLTQFPSRIAAATEDRGTLSFRFDDGSEIAAAPDDQYEAWEVVMGRKRVVCMPGGELAIWS